MEPVFFQESMVNKHYYLSLVQTVDQYEAQFNQSFHTIDLKVEEKTNLYQKYKQVRNTLIKVTTTIQQIDNIFEKLKNLFSWTDSYRTFYFLVFLFIVYVLSSSIPTRVLLFLVVFDQFETNHNYYHKKYVRNIQLLEVVYVFLVKKYFHEYSVQHSANIPFKAYLKGNTKSYQEKIARKMRKILNLQIGGEIFSECETPQQLVHVLATCDEKLMVNDDFQDL